MANNDIVPGFDDEKDGSLMIKLTKSPEIDGCLLFSLTGYIDTYNSNYFQKRVAKAIESGFIRLVFLCGNLNYVSSTGIGSFTSFLKAIKSRGGEMVLVEIQAKVYEVFQLLGFSQFFTIKDSLEEAYNVLRSGSSTETVSLFPKTFECPICSKKLRASKSGRFRCSECKTILAIDNVGQVFLG
jgi:anti-anti-sigma factor